MKRILFYPIFWLIIFVVKILDLIFGIEEKEIKGVYFVDEHENTVKWWLTDGVEK
jgi:hypothetical protein